MSLGLQSCAPVLHPCLFYFLQVPSHDWAAPPPGFQEQLYQESSACNDCTVYELEFMHSLCGPLEGFAGHMHLLESMCGFCGPLEGFLGHMHLEFMHGLYSPLEGFVGHMHLLESMHGLCGPPERFTHLTYLCSSMPVQWQGRDAFEMDMETLGGLGPAQENNMAIRL